jgi:hypothetical protein
MLLPYPSTVVYMLERGQGLLARLSANYCFIKLNKLTILVPVLRKFGSGPTFVAALGSVNLVPSILIPSDRARWTVTKNTNHHKTCINIHNTKLIHFCYLTAGCFSIRQLSNFSPLISVWTRR